jgi:hypothetical protein
MTASTTTKNQSAITTADTETSVLSRWEALASDIAIATEDSGLQEFDYRDAVGNKLARSWMAHLRKLKGRIERARKEAKAIHLQRGKAVDETARTLEGAVLGLIEPHEKAIEAIEAEERPGSRFTGRCWIASPAWPKVSPVQPRHMLDWLS